jgi:uncharacterized protein YcbK (DUF882 family)
MPQDVNCNVQKLANQLQQLRDHFKQPITITSGYRCESHNKAIGGAKNSQHVLGKAADIKVDNTSPKKVYEVIERLINSGDMLQGGLGLYRSWVHYDIRKTRARW